jgi:5-methylthioribose kinase
VDIENLQELLDYLRKNQRIQPNEIPRFRVLPGGVSNRAVLVELPGKDSWVLKQALPKLRVPDEWFCSPERIVREADGMQVLARIAPRDSITRLVFLDQAEYLLAMEAVPEPHENWNSVLLSGRVEMDHFEQCAELLAAIHRGGAAGEFREAFADRSFFESLRIEPYYLATSARVPVAQAFLEELVRETRARRVTLVHGDFSPKNILIGQGRLVLLDHEVIHFGDPAFDIGFSMAHFLSKAHHLTSVRPMLAVAANRYFKSYAQCGGLAEVIPSVRHTLGCLLARVCGRSKLEYLDDEERCRQRDAVTRLMADPPRSVEELIARFLDLI